MTKDDDSKASNRRSGKDRRLPPDRRNKQELFNSGEEKHTDRRAGHRRKGPRRNDKEEEW